MFPAPRAREVVTREQPRLPLAYHLQQVPVPARWDDHPGSMAIAAAGAYSGSVGSAPG
jgi:hypothetical protein